MRELKDIVAEKIATFLMRKLNGLHQGLIIVKSIAAYDKYQVPMDQYPLLKVYRISDQYYAGTALRRSSMNAAYCLVLPDQEQLAGITSVIGDEIVSTLTKDLYKETQILISDEPRVEYRTLLSEIGQPVYAFIRVYFTVYN